LCGHVPRCQQAFSPRKNPDLEAAKREFRPDFRKGLRKLHPFAE